jgi:hypothetical protein
LIRYALDSIRAADEASSSRGDEVDLGEVEDLLTLLGHLNTSLGTRESKE